MKKQGSKWPTIRSRKDQRIEALEAELAEERAQLDKLRKLLWLYHGHTGLYGDDGEMMSETDNLGATSDEIIESLQGDVMTLTRLRSADRRRIAELEAALRDVALPSYPDFEIWSRRVGVSEDQYYIQNVGYCGNCLRWWRPDGHGYTNNLDEAWKVGKAKAEQICRCRPNSDIPRLCSLIDGMAERHVNVEPLLDSPEESVKTRRAALDAARDEGAG